MKILSVFGTRPEWIKLSILMKLLDRRHDHIMLHTGQHYTPALDREIRLDLGLRKPNYQLKMGSGSLGMQLNRALPRMKKIFAKEAPDLVIVQGDTNSALAGAVMAAELGIPLAHVEAGCRSGNLKAPEERNRILIDHLAQLHFAADNEALQNLRREGINRALLSGSTGVEPIRKLSCASSVKILKKQRLKRGAYLVATLHRAENADSVRALKQRLEIVAEAARWLPVICPLHPRTQRALRRFRVRIPQNVRVLPPLSYREFISLINNCCFILSDSGGIQEEAAVLQRPCLILRSETEWMRLVRAGKNFLCPSLTPSTRRLIRQLATDKAFYHRVRKKRAPGLTGGASRRILSQVTKFVTR